MVTVLSGGKGKFTKDTLAVLTTTEAQKSLIQQSLLQTSLDKNVMGLVRSQVMTISASRGMYVHVQCDVKRKMDRCNVCVATYVDMGRV